MADPDLKIQVPGEELTTTVPDPEPNESAPDAPAPAGKAPKAPKADKAQAEAPAKPEGLPDQSTVNPDKIARAVLTRQGWVVPTAKPKA